MALSDTITELGNSIINLVDVKVAQGGGGVPAQSVSNALVYVDDGTFKLIWTDPADITAGGYNFYAWQKTVIVAKVGSYPTSPTDGTTILTETTRNSYSSTYYSWTPQTYDDYYFRAFCYSTTNVYSRSTDNNFTGLAPNPITNPKSHKTGTGYQLTWTDPADNDLLSWAATYIIRKEGSYPTSIEDGVQVLKSTTRNAYSSTPYLDVVPNVSNNYYYRAFTYSSNNLYNTNSSQEFEELAPLAATNCFVDKTSHTYPELIWTDPSDYTMCSWAKTVIVRKEGSAPTSATDGTVIYTETIKNNHIDNTNAYTDTTAVSGTSYYYKAFPCSTNGVYCTSSESFTEKSIYSEIYEFIIDTSESNPNNAVSYAGANASFTPASMNFSTGAINYGSWENAFFQPRPVMLKYDGTVDYELSHSDFTKKLDGVTASDVTNSSYSGNCMIGFPQVWLKFVQDDSTHIHVYIASSQIDNNYRCYSHYNNNGTLLDEIYVAAFEPSNVSSKLRSLAGQTILVNTAGTTMRTYAQANGNGWDFLDLGTLQLIQMLFILMFKSLDSQSKAGAGVVQGSASSYTTTGTTKNRGMFYATVSDATSSSATVPIKTFGIENLWGNRWKWINGLTTYKQKIFYKLCNYTTDGTTTTGYNPTATAPGYKSYTRTSDLTTYQLKMPNASDGLMWYWGSSDSAVGSNSTYYSDYMYYGQSSSSNNVGCAQFGGYCSDGADAGLFYVDLGYYNPLSSSYDFYGASLSCKPL